MGHGVTGGAHKISPFNQIFLTHVKDGMRF
jgi:hypothetical protein